MIGNVRLNRVDATPEYALGETFVIGDKVFRYVLYSNGTGNIPAIRGQICYDCVVDAANITTPYQVTCDLGSASPVSNDNFAGVIQADVVLDTEYCWVQIQGKGRVAMLADAAITRTTSALTERLIPGADDGTVKVMADGATGEPELWFALLLANIDGVPTAATDRYIATIPAGQTTTAQFQVGETVTANTDTAVVVEVLKRGTTDYGLIVSTVTSDYWANAETAVGGTSAASGVLGAVGYAVFPQNYKLRRDA